MAAQQKHLAASPRGHSREAAPARRCLVTRQTLPTGSMLRFVVDPEGRVCPDIDHKLPGRGLWLTARRDILVRACASNLFAASLRRSVEVPGDMAERVELLLVRRCTELLGLARRAGQAVAGFEKVRNAMRAGDVSLLVCASDGSEAERRRVAGNAAGVAVFDSLTGSEIGAALGRDFIVHAGLSRGRLAERLAFEGTRLAGIRGPQDVKESG